MNLGNRAPSLNALMRQLIAAVVVTLFSSGTAHALPIPIVPPAPEVQSLTSGPYKDGYSLDATGYQHTVYLYYREKMGATWGPWLELRMDENPALNTPAFLASVNAKTVPSRCLMLAFQLETLSQR